MDVFSPAKRSEIMRRVQSTGTRPELLIRRLVSGLGYRYRLNSEKLPGHPDLVFSRLRRVIFVHGCFWHGHSCKSAQLPTSRREYWEAKRLRNVARDRRVRRTLNRDGWESLVVWECQLNKEITRDRIRKFLAGRE